MKKLPRQILIELAQALGLERLVDEPEPSPLTHAEVARLLRWYVSRMEGGVVSLSVWRESPGEGGYCRPEPADLRRFVTVGLALDSCPHKDKGESEEAVACPALRLALLEARIDALQVDAAAEDAVLKGSGFRSPIWRDVNRLYQSGDAIRESRLLRWCVEHLARRLGRARREDCELLPTRSPLV